MIYTGICMVTLIFHPALTDREREVLECMAAGYDRHDIAAALHIVPRTADFHRYNIWAKFGVPNDAGAVFEAWMSGELDAKRVLLRKQHHPNRPADDQQLAA